MRLFMKKVIEFFIKYRSVFLSSILASLSRLDLQLGFLSFFALIPLIYFFEKDLRKKDILISAIVWASIYNIIVLHFIALVTLPGYLLLFGLFSFYFFILFYMIKKGSNAFPKLRFLIFATFWITFEILQNYGELRFPWFNLGYSLAEYNLLIQLAEIGGVYLISLLIIIANFLFYQSHKKHKFIVITLLFFLVWLLGGYFLKSRVNLRHTDKTATIVQGSIPQELKWDSSYRDFIIDTYADLSLQQANTDLIIWPESAIPGYFLRNNGLRNRINSFIQESKKPLFSGFPHYKANPYKEAVNRYLFYNSTSMINPDLSIEKIYHKNILVPFGERLPLLDLFPFLWKIHLGQANWEYGTESVRYILGNTHFSPLICFEIAFPQYVAKTANQNINFLINQTNDAWFKRTTGTYQHAMMTIFRAIENRTQIFRAANTGISMIVNPAGEIEKRIPLYESSTISAKIYQKNNLTIFNKNYRLFLGIMLIISGLILMRIIMTNFRG